MAAVSAWHVPSRRVSGLWHTFTPAPLLPVWFLFWLRWQKGPLKERALDATTAGAASKTGEAVHNCGVGWAGPVGLDMLQCMYNRLHQPILCACPGVGGTPTAAV